MSTFAREMDRKDKLCQLVLMAYANFNTGALLAILGTTLPDLQCIFNEDLNKVSSLFLPLGLGTTTSCLLFPVLIKKCNTYLLMATSMLSYCLSVAVVAITPFIEFAIVAFLVAGLTVGVTTPGTLHMCNLVFSEDAYVFHIIACAVSVGSFISPILATPFLGTPVGSVATFEQNISLVNTSVALEWQIGLFEKEPNVYITNNSENVSLNMESYCETSSSTVNYFYIIMGSFALPLAVAYCWYFYRDKSSAISNPASNDPHIALGNESSLYEHAFIVLAILCFPSMYGLAYTYASYLTVVGNEGPLSLSTLEMALLTSIFWLHFLLGRIASTIASFYAKQMVIMYVCLIGQILSMILLTVTGSSVLCLWIGSLSLGFFSGPGFGTLMAWSRECIVLTPCLLGMFSLVDLIGITLLPFISGQLISSYGLVSHYYYCLTFTLLQLTMFCLLHGLSSVIRTERRG